MSGYIRNIGKGYSLYYKHNTIMLSHGSRYVCDILPTNDIIDEDMREKCINHVIGIIMMSKCIWDKALDDFKITDIGNVADEYISYSLKVLKEYMFDVDFIKLREEFGI